ncbi:HEPN domain-containing protein [Sphingobacterium sp. SGL-16]|uniref:HEPN domain-containing protein n=1 Tax=Sphingobacterium sp. SGL-16 TaxID=2710883 RepID=UPI00397BA6B8
MNSRHYYSHLFEKKANRKIAEGAGLYHLTNKLQYLLICCFLHELGLENAKINDILQKYSERL